MTFSPQQLVIDNEIAGAVRRMLQGFKVTPETVALDVIKDVGPMGNFMYHKHTLDHIGGLGYSELTAVPSDAGGFQDPIELAIEQTNWILENHEPEPLSGAQQRELKRILRSADQDVM